MGLHFYYSDTRNSLLWCDKNCVNSCDISIIPLYQRILHEKYGFGEDWLISFHFPLKIKHKISLWKRFLNFNELC